MLVGSHGNNGVTNTKIHYWVENELRSLHELLFLLKEKEFKVFMLIFIKLTPKHLKLVFLFNFEVWGVLMVNF